MQDTDHFSALRPGTRLNQYLIEHVLGQGGFGIVYRARHEHLEESVVIKEFLPTEVALRHDDRVQAISSARQAPYSEGLARFIAEGRTLVKLRHPNIVRCRDLFLANDTAYLVMDFEDGLPLDVLIAELEARGQRYSEAQLLHFLLPIADGLDYIHNQSVLHRDIKPGNIFIRRSDGSPVIIDFGAAKQDFAVASQSQAPYTDFYAPLDQIEGSGAASPTIDVHAFGALMYRIVTQQHGPRAQVRASALISGKPDPLVPASEIARGEYSERLLTLIDQCLAFKNTDRPQSMAEVRALFTDTETDQTGVPRPVPRPPEPDPPGGPDTPTVNDTPRRRGPVIAVSMTLAAVVLMGATGFFFFDPRNNPDGNTSGTEVRTMADTILPGSSERRLSAAQLSSLDAAELRLARNEIFARNGRYFSSEDLTRHFSQFDWYRPHSWDVALTEVESFNVQLILKEEQSR
ncbi:MAG: protein kinase domain-containing protein [Marinobacter sp.]|uniref:protein kinase domain-containing protein n=1 Tax=Marinobacter sp. TaxID=50741 RepID=UPI003C657400